MSRGVRLMMQWGVYTQWGVCVSGGVCVCVYVAAGGVYICAMEQQAEWGWWVVILRRWEGGFMRAGDLGLQPDEGRRPAPDCRLRTDDCLRREGAEQRR